MSIPFSFNPNTNYSASTYNFFSDYSINTFGTTTFSFPMLNTFDFGGIFNSFSSLNTPNMGFGSFGQNLFSDYNFFSPLPQYPTNISFGGLTSFSSSAFTNTRTTTPFGYTTRGSRRVVSDRATNPEVQRALDFARTQIGVREAGSSNNSSAINKYRGGVANGQPWCASFVSYCFGNATGSTQKSPFGYTSSSQQIKNRAIQAGKYSDKNDGYKPKVGDLAVWTYKDNASGHVGIISAINEDGTFEVIEGNCSNSVKQCTRSFNTKDLSGFVRMNEWVQQA